MFPLCAGIVLVTALLCTLFLWLGYSDDSGPSYYPQDTPAPQKSKYNSVSGEKRGYVEHRLEREFPNASQEDVDRAADAIKKFNRIQAERRGE